MNAGRHQRPQGRRKCGVLAATLFLSLGDIASAQTTPATGAMADGSQHRVLLKSDGTVWTIGNNYSGQLGDGTTTDRPTFAVVPSLMGVAAVAAGSDHSLALKTNGTVWSWGYNGNGQLGDGTTVQRPTPVQIGSLSGIVAIASQHNHSVAIRSDGTLWSWGHNWAGQLGDGTTNERIFPFQVRGLTGVVAVAVGISHGLAVKSDGTVWGWGSNWAGEVGDGTMTQRTSPVQVRGLAGAVAVAAGYGNSSALKSDGTVWTWGNTGQSSPVTPTTLTDVSGIKAIQRAGGLSIALKSDGTVWTWWRESSGGGMWFGVDSIPIAASIPMQVAGITNAVAVTAAAARFAVLRNDGIIWAWGGEGNNRGELGDGSPNVLSVPVQVGGTSDAKSAVVGLARTFALGAGTARGWGTNGFGELGNGTTTATATPTLVTGLAGATAINSAKGGSHSSAIKSDGTLWSWGYNWAGQLGDGTTINRSTPVLVGGLTGVIAAASGGYHSVAVRSTGAVWAWGANWHGQLGDGTTTDRLRPVQVAGLASVASVAAGDNHTVALKGDGTVWAWGENWHGQLGDGTNTRRTKPTQVMGLSGVTAIKTGGRHTVALKRDGTVWCWGANWVGQLGDGTTTNRNSPVQASGLTGISAISGAAALKADGTAFVWGGQFGPTPVLHAKLGVVAAIDVGTHHSVATRANGTVWVWGTVNTSGQLGFSPHRIKRAAIRLSANAGDSDQDGMDDAWEIQYFGNLSHTGYVDSDGDGLTDIEEFARGSDPTHANADGDLFSDFADPFPNDYYNGLTPLLGVIGGNNQTGTAGQFNAQPFDVAVWNSAGTVPLVNAPVVFTVTQGGGSLATINIGNPTVFTSGTVRTDVDGTAQAYYKQPATGGIQSLVTVTAGAATALVFQTQSTATVADSDGDGLLDAWELQYFGNLAQTATGDPDGDSLSNLQEFLLGRNPTRGAMSDSTGLVGLRFYGPQR